MSTGLAHLVRREEACDTGTTCCPLESDDMSASGRRRPSASPSILPLVIYGVVTGLIITGAGGVLSWMIYGTSNPATHVLPIIAIAILAVAAGLLANRIVTWLMAGPIEEHEPAAATTTSPRLLFPSAATTPRDDSSAGDGRNRSRRSYDSANICQVGNPYDHANGRSRSQD